MGEENYANFFPFMCPLKLELSKHTFLLKKERNVNKNQISSKRLRKGNRIKKIKLRSVALMKKAKKKRWNLEANEVNK